MQMTEKNYLCDNKSFVMYKNWESQFEMLNDSELGELIRAAFRFVATGEVPTFGDRALTMTFNMMKECFVRDAEKWEETRERIQERNTVNGSKGGAPKGNKNAAKRKGSDVSNEKQPKTTQASKSTQTTETTQSVEKQPKQPVNVNVNDNVNVNANETVNVNETVTANENADVNEPVSMTVSEPVNEDNYFTRLAARKEQEHDRQADRQADKMTNNFWNAEKNNSPDFEKVDLTDAEREHLIRLSDRLTVDRYIENIRKWQVKNRRLNSKPFVSIRRWIEEDGADRKPAEPVSKPVGSYDESKPMSLSNFKSGIGCDEFDAFANELLENDFYMD